MTIFYALDSLGLLVCYRAHFSVQETVEKPFVAISGDFSLINYIFLRVYDHFLCFPLIRFFRTFSML